MEKCRIGYFYDAEDSSFTISNTCIDQSYEKDYNVEQIEIISFRPASRSLIDESMSELQLG
jgi:hypothetical protein